MKKKLRSTNYLTLVQVIILTVTMHSENVVSINFTDGGDGELFKNSTAGVIPTVNWENIGKATTAEQGQSNDLTSLGKLRDNNGLPSAINYSSTGLWDGSYDDVDDSNFSNNDDLMFVNWSQTSNGSITLTNVNQFAATYDLYVYCWDEGAHRTGIVSAN